MSVQNLNHRHLHVYQEIVEYRSRNVEWPDVLSLIEALGRVVERPDGKFDFEVGSASAVFTKPHGKDLTIEQLADLRRFFAQAGVSESK